jgi:hypothetical protein
MSLTNSGLTGALVRLIALGVGLVLGPAPGFCKDVRPQAAGLAAKVNGQAITVKELEASLAEQLSAMEKEIFELKMKKLDELIGQRLLQAEAARRGLSVEALLAQEVDAKVPEVTEEQAAQFYEQNKNRMVERPEAELKQKSKEILTKYRRVHEREKYVQALREKAKVTLYLQAPAGVP